MAAKIRVHELARELGLTNKECLDLCLALGIGVKTHSSGIEEAQADRVRRRAQRDGLVRDRQPEAPSRKAATGAEADGKADGDKAAATTKKAATKKAAAKKAPAAKKTAGTAAPAEAPAAESPEPAVAEAGAAAEPAAPAAEPEVSERPRPADTPAERPAAAAAAAAPTPPAPPAPATGAPRSVPPPPAPPPRPAATRPTPPAPPGRLVTSSGSERPVRRPDLDAAPAAAPRPAAAAGAPPSAPAARPARPTAPPPTRPTPPEQGGPRPSGPATGARPAPGGGRAPESLSGKPIPPPPGPPVSSSGKPIPPPPGQGGRGPTAPPRGARPAGGPPGRGRPGMGGGGAGPGGGAGRPFGGGPGGRPGGAPPMGGGPAGGPGGRPGGGPRGGQRTPPRRRGRRRRSREELQPMEVPTYTPASAPVPEGVVVVERASTPQDLGPKLNRTAADVVRFLMQQGEMVTATQSLTDDMIELFAAEIGADVRLVDPGEEQEVELQRQLGVDELFATNGEGQPEPRPPVITVMGHVDHGKTKLLDRIRNANVVEGEAGGITQHIGAYQAVKNGRRITFIDTPGHEAFTAMRARGAQATDIVVLVVAADDGVMPQTVEALNHAKAAEVPIVVAINKIDREEANPDRVKRQLSEQDLIPSDWGGDTEMVPVSALAGQGIDELLETLLLVADVQDPPIAASPEGRAAGVVLEANLDVGRGPVASVLVQRGTLRVGDPLVAGAAWGRVRALIDDHGETVKEAGPSTPVQVLGLNEVADAGDQFIVAPDEKLARSVAETREHWQRVASLGREAAVTGGGARLEDIFEQIQQGEVATLNLVLKADVTGSLEALTEALRKLERDDVKLSFVQRGVGGITRSDVQLAAASNATIIGFNVRPDRNSRELAMAEGVEIRTYEIIYQVLEDIENALLGMLQPTFEEVVTGEAEVREIFSVPRVGRVAGCYVTNGVITRGSKVRFLRDGTVIWKGTISSLKRFKDDVREVQSGFECGIGLSDFQDLKQGDIIETFEEREIPRT
ncbi:MAG TPA: translation initiation factor IF-2 [Acidimicrobiales bacterium]|nr:translation initiation factor IF-2 [Acidimicrobiales bacterium]